MQSKSIKVQYGANQEIKAVYKNLLTLDTIANASNSNINNMKI